MKLLLDTHAFLWMVSGDSRVPEQVRAVLRADDNSVWLSAISVWEIAIKQVHGRLKLPTPAVAYSARHRRAHHVSALAVEEAVAQHLERLPPIHRDPFDRILICQAIEHDMTLVTADEQIRRYPVKTLWA
ncbi:MAG: type II toxin-antitoxin system VapC family toxin [Acidobacteria bacterium]|nr:type II toxin-antitoxin system VapC family toxin [Acidobacteriota bacterium]